MKTKSIIKLALNLFISFATALFIGLAVSNYIPEVNPVSFAGVVALVNFVIQFVGVFAGFKSVKGFAFAGLLTEVWSQQISENLYQDNSFMKRATDHSMWVNHKTVHVPQAGPNSAVQQNRSVLPASIGSRTDSDLTYNLNQYTSDPIVITNLEELQISYNKRQSVLYNMMQQLNYVIATQTLYTWGTSGATRIVQTTGTGSALNLPTSTATGTRKMTTIADITNVKAVLDKDNVPQQGRVLLVPQYMYNIDLLNIPGIVQAYQFGQAVAPEGVVARLMGFDIMIRPDVLLYDNSGTPVIKAINGDGSVASPATTDQGAAIAYHPNFVAVAKGSVTPYYNAGSGGNGLPEWYGSLFSAEVMHGATKLYTSQKGIVTLVQGT